MSVKTLGGCKCACPLSVPFRLSWESSCSEIPSDLFWGCTAGCNLFLARTRWTEVRGRTYGTWPCGSASVPGPPRPVDDEPRGANLRSRATTHPTGRGPSECPGRTRHTDRVDRSQLKKELARLRKGRGVGRPSLITTVGPLLLGILDVGPETTEEEARTRLLMLLSGEASGLPGDLRLLVQAAFGLTSSHPLLTERLADVGSLLQRDPRTLRRRLAEADELLADRIASRFAGRQGLARPGFHWVSYHLDIDVSTDRPVFVSTRTLVSSIDQLTEIGEVVSIPIVGDSDSLHVEGLAGCTYVGRDSLSDTTWRLRFSLPRPLGLGETHDIMVRFTWPGREWIQPVAAIVPMRPVERFGVKVSFGHPRSCSTAWVLDGTLPTAIGDPSSGQPLTDDTAEVTFDDLLLGHAYGVAWTWSDNT